MAKRSRLLGHISVVLTISGVYSSLPTNNELRPPIPVVDPLSSLWAESSSDPALDDPELGQCDTSFLSRARWTNGAKAELTEQGFDVTSGSLRFAPIGTISNPDGTYGSVNFDEGASYPDGFCNCLSGNTTVSESCEGVEGVAKAVSSSTREQPCKGTYVLQPEDAVVIVGCTPPASQYFGLQTNVYSKFSFDEDLNRTGMTFPCVAPYDSINTASINTVGGTNGAMPHDSAYIVISTADQGTADAITEALVNAGAPAGAINYDSLTNDDVKLWSGGDWTDDLPDSLQMVIRINGPHDQAETKRFIQGSVLGSQRALLVRANGEKVSQPMNQTNWRPRVVAPNETDINATYSPVLDTIVESINQTAQEQGYVMSYFGELLPAMDFGYVEYPISDVEECCLQYPHAESYFWNGVIHYSTRDCLYEAGGGYTDGFGDWNDGEPGLVGTTRAMNMEVIGENATVETYQGFSCYGEDADELYFSWQCAEGCSNCAANYSASQIGLSGCTAQDSHSYQFSCDNGSAIMNYYADAQCQDLVTVINEKSCDSVASNPPDDLWAGGYMRESSVVVVVGAMSLQLNASALHDVYLPVYSNYNDADAELDFKETELQGSSSPWIPSNATEEELGLFENVFVAQWARPGHCLANGDAAADDQSGFCYEIDEAVAPSPFMYNLIVRHYLDPNTGTGPHKDALPRHRFLVLDKVEV